MILYFLEKCRYFQAYADIGIDLRLFLCYNIVTSQNINGAFMIDKFDYAEPNCPLCNGKDFYYPKSDAPLGRIPVQRIIDKVDSLFNKNNYAEAGRLLTYWRNEAIDLKDKHGELAIESELIGYYRKQNNKEQGLLSVSRALVLVEELNQSEMASGATVFINCATAYKAFGMVNEALPLYIRAKNVYSKTLSADDTRFGGLYNNMALTLTELEKFDEAEKAYLNALEVMSNAENGEAECAITYINLAYMYEGCGKTELITECMDKAYELLNSPTLPHDGYYAFVLEKCAPAFDYFGESTICDKMIAEAKEIYERA